MSEGKAYEGVKDGNGGPVRGAVPSLAEVVAASALLEEVARERGLDVRRLDEELVVCGDGRRRVLFHGLVSSSTGKLAHALCSNDAWLRAHLARHGLPVVRTRLVGADDADFALRAAEDLGFPVRMRSFVAGHAADSVVEPVDRIATSVDSFHQAWRAVRDAARGIRFQVILEHRSPGTVSDIEIIGGSAVAAPALAGPDREQAESLALRVLSALPNLTSGEVRLITGAHQTMVDSVDPTLRSRMGRGGRPRSQAAAVLSFEFSDT
jgi:hypothetical protein